MECDNQAVVIAVNQGLSRDNRMLQCLRERVTSQAQPQPLLPLPQPYYKNGLKCKNNGKKNLLQTGYVY